MVVEARERSGALITADLALEEGREVFAVPGEITSALSAGTNRLLALGATPVTSAGDVVQADGVEPQRVTPPAMEGDRARVFEALGAGASAIDELVVATGLDAASVAAALSELELSGLASEGDGLYRRTASG